GFRGGGADWVLSDFDAVERAEMVDVVARAIEAVRRVVDVGIGPAMNVVNTAQPSASGSKKS
ncbi:MAG TPA: hypothetical protein VH044_16830, partial [Polyangiaceae bacterium]|nr:hypothetical protein [Polyangiaceae bacterium]